MPGRPVVPITLWGVGKRLNVEALVDTGASEIVLPMRIWDLVDPVFRPDETGEPRPQARHQGAGTMTRRTCGATRIVTGRSAIGSPSA